jgi:hypothetical protein
MAGVLLGMFLAKSEPGLSFADERDSRNKPRTAFQSGGERSVVVLEKISKQIEQLDRRIANIEVAVLAGSNPNNAGR